jgi:uracil-DNA glycosylase
LSPSLLFIGEKPSPTAEAKGLRWQDGKLAARTLFAALDAAGIDRSRCGFANLFGLTADAPERQTSEVRARLEILAATAATGTRIVALGSKVARHLERSGVPHVRLTHPAARGAIRARDRYVQHVREVLAFQ